MPDIDRLRRFEPKQLHAVEIECCDPFAGEAHRGCSGQCLTIGAKLGGGEDQIAQLPASANLDPGCQRQRESNAAPIGLSTRPERSGVI